MAETSGFGCLAFSLRVIFHVKVYFCAFCVICSKRRSKYDVCVLQYSTHEIQFFNEGTQNCFEFRSDSWPNISQFLMIFLITRNFNFCLCLHGTIFFLTPSFRLCPVLQVKRLRWRPTEQNDETSQLGVCSSDHSFRIFKFNSILFSWSTTKKRRFFYTNICFQIYTGFS